MAIGPVELQVFYSKIVLKKRLLHIFQTVFIHT